MTERTPFPQERIDQIVAEVMAATEAADEARAKAVAAGARCMCCDEPLPPGPPGRECDACQNL